MQRLRSFAYHEPTTLAEAVSVLTAAGDDVHVLAGGTDLVVDMKTGRMRPNTVVNLKRIPGMTLIEAVDGGTRIGALTKVTDIEASSRVQEEHPALAQAAAVLASPPVRALATIGGGIGRASPASDLAPPLIVLNAVATIEGPGGPREEPVEDLYAGPGITTLDPADIITSVFLPERAQRSGSAHLKIGARGGGTDIAIVGSCAAVVLGDGLVVEDARIVLASVAPVPLRARAAEDALLGEIATEEVIGGAADLAAAACTPITDLRGTAEHRLVLARVLTQRALRAVVAMAEEAC